MSAHTPGPWFAKPFGRGSLSWIVTANLADAHFDVCNVVGMSSVPGRVAANAALIAKAPIAPKLANALRVLLTLIEDDPLRGDDEPPPVIEARAALAEWDAQ